MKLPYRNPLFCTSTQNDTNFKVNRKQNKDFYWLDTNLNPRFKTNARAEIMLTHSEL